jgi:TonB family protein
LSQRRGARTLTASADDTIGADREARIMAHAIGLRATSFATSAALLGLAVMAALTMTVVQRIADPTEGGPIITIAEPEPPPPEPVRARPPEPPQVRPVDGETTQPIAPPLDTMAQPIATSEPANAYSVPTVVNPQWLRQPRDLARYYPERALRREIEGRVVLDCSVSVRGELDCAVASETPANWGFGAAALAISRDYQMVPAMRGGVPVEARHRMVVPFELR